MPQFTITAFEKWEHKVFYDITANSMSEAIDAIRSGEAIPSDHHIGEVLGDSLVCVQTIKQDGKTVEVPEALREERPEPQALTPRELATIHAALTLWQREDLALFRGADEEAEELMRMAESSGLPALSGPEIDALCERLSGVDATGPGGRCDTCGAACDADGCTTDRAHAIAK